MVAIVLGGSVCNQCGCDNGCGCGGSPGIQANCVNYLDTILDLRAASISDSVDLSVLLGGGISVGDGFGGFYVWDGLSTATDDGALIINSDGNIGSGRWVRSGADVYAVATQNARRTIQNRFQEVTYITDYLAPSQVTAIRAGTEVDITAALTAAITDTVSLARPNLILLPKGKLSASAFFNITGPVRIVGQGDSQAASAVGATTFGTTLRYTGASGPFLAFTNVNGGSWGLENITIDGSLSTIALNVDGCIGGHSEGITILGGTVCALKVGSDTTALATCSWNNFHNCQFTTLDFSGTNHSTKAAVWLAGTTAGGNACHNTFTGSTKIIHGGAAPGLLLGGCDNNSFDLTFIFAATGATNFSVLVDPTEVAGFPVAQTFRHLEAIRGWHQPNGTPNGSAIIFGYSTDNGEPFPTYGTSQAPLVVTSGQSISGLRSIGGTPGNNLIVGFIWPAASTSVAVPFPTNEPDSNYAPFLSPDNNLGGREWFTNRAIGGFTAHLAAAPGVDINCAIFLLRGT